MYQQKVARSFEGLVLLRRCSCIGRWVYAVAAAAAAVVAVVEDNGGKRSVLIAAVWSEMKIMKEAEGYVKVVVVVFA